MAKNDINKFNEKIECETSQKITLAAACMMVSLSTNIKAADIMNNIEPSNDNNQTTLNIESCDSRINTDVIIITDDEGHQIAKTLEKDEQPELTDYSFDALKFVSNYSFEDKMYLFSDQQTSVSKDHPGNFSDAYNVSSFYSSNHVALDTPCEPNKDAETVERWVETIISFDDMNERDKELYFRLLNTLFQKAKINHTGGELPDNMAHTKLEKIITTFSSFAKRQLLIPNVNNQEELKQLFEKSEETVSKFNLNVITELAYMENLLMGTQPKVIDRGDGVLYATPDMSREFMVFLASRDAEGNQFITVDQINSILPILNQLNHNLPTVEVAEEPELSEPVMDYAQLQETYLSYFLTDKLSKKFEANLLALTEKNQSTLLQVFQIGSEELGETLSKKDKHQFVLRLLKTFEEVNKESGKAEKRGAGIIKKLPALVGGEFEKLVMLIAKQADYYEYEMSDEDKEILAKLTEKRKSDEIILAKKRIDNAALQALINFGKDATIANNN